MFSVTHLDRVTFNPQVMAGKACIRDTRVTVSLILNLVANGMTRDDIIAAYPYLEAEDMAQVSLIFFHPAVSL